MPPIQALLVQLQGSRTDLGLIVEAASRSPRSYIVVLAAAVRAWEVRDPRAWHHVRTWLTTLGKTVVEIESQDAGRRSKEDKS
ncbi:MAG TPA: hypothetical protein VML54_04535 [Candidatus Limnocylindrales bacterium]|nr:hypothetical protein [Candidatus Limnocylindrales bacterium]